MICVDASVAAKWVLEEEHTPEARALYRAAVTQEGMAAPPLLPIEVTNTLFRYVRRRPELDTSDALTLLDDFLAFEVLLLNPVGLHRDALAIAAELGLSATYDAHYLALARRLDCDLWTDDRRLLRQAGDAFPFVRWIGDIDPASSAGVGG